MKTWRRLEESWAIEKLRHIPMWFFLLVMYTMIPAYGYLVAMEYMYLNPWWGAAAGLLLAGILHWNKGRKNIIARLTHDIARWF